MIKSVSESQAEFYRKFLMARKVINPEEYGINLTKEAFVGEVFEAFAKAYEGRLSIDELVLHPREALNFCDDVRRTGGWFSLPDDIILRALMNDRKNPPKE